MNGLTRVSMGGWICPFNYYQCNRSGQCIPDAWLCNGAWDCNDGSDEEAIQLIDELSEHNARVVPDLAAMKEKCRKTNSMRPFAGRCNTSIEYPCLLAQTYGDPLDLTLNRPCIHLSKIGK